MSTYEWEKNLIKITPYVPGEQSKLSDIVKINANENPYPPSPKVEEAIKNFSVDDIRFYPNANATDLKQAIADNFNVNINQVFVGNGSDDVIALSFMAFFNSDLPIVYPDITYSFYPVWCDLLNIKYKNPKLNDMYRINVEDYYAKNGGVIIPNPNAPTGIAENREFLVDLLEHNKDVIVMIDEAYVDFSDFSAVELLEEYPNLVIVQTFSKSRSLAGLRVGFAIASEKLIATLEAVKNSYNSYTLDSVAIVSATAAMKDKAYFEETVAKIVATRERVTEEMRGLGFEIFDSKTNFILATHPKYKALDIFEHLKTKKVFVRYFNIPRVDNHLRISIGTDKEMDRFLTELKDYLSQQ